MPEYTEVFFLVTVGYPLLKYIAGSELHWIGEISAVRGHFPGAQSGRPSAGLEFFSLMYLIQAYDMLQSYDVEL